MGSLDLLDYLQALDEALAPRLPAALRRQALRDARRIVDTLAFRFAILDERPMPEDLDYLRAIEAMKPAPRAAEVLLRRAPHYRRVRRRRLGTTFVSLGVVMLLAAGLAWVATSEKAEPLATLSYATAGEETTSLERSFNVTEEMTRVYFAGTVFVSPDTRGNVELFLRDPSGQTRLVGSWNERGTYYLRENEYDPAAGQWTLFVDFNGARGSIQLDVSGVSPAR